MLRTVTAIRYVTPLREGGSVPGLMEADDDGLYVVKLRGAAQGPKALIAELVAGEIGRALGLPVPEIVLVDLDPVLSNAEPDPEIQEPIRRSGGLNLGLDFLPGSLPFSPVAGPRPEQSLAAAVVWFDALVTNIDRSPRNPNIVVWHRKPWLIDHGAALYIHHHWQRPDEHARQPFAPIRDHVLLPFAGSILTADHDLHAVLTEGRLSEIVAAIPDDWLAGESAFATLAEHRRAYVDYLLRRLREPRAFVEEAERARERT